MKKNNLKFKTLLSFLAIFLGLFCFAKFSYAATYYFSQSGNDSTGNGTQLNPWKTINKANSVMSGLPDGQHSILFKRGDLWTLGSGGEANGILITVSGTSDSNRVIVGDYGSGNLPKFDGNYNTGADLVYIQSQSYITIQNLEIYHAGIGKNSIGYGINENVSYIKVTGCKIHDNHPDSGQFLIAFETERSEYGQGAGTASNIEISYNTVYNAAWNCIKIYGCTGTGNSVHHNTIYGANHIGVDTLSFSTTYVDIYSNNIYDCVSCIYGPSLTNSTVYDNDCHDSRSYGGPDAVYGIKLGVQVRSASGVTIRNNRFWNIDVPNRDAINSAAIWIDNNANIKLWNNTIYNSWKTLRGWSNQNLQTVNNLNYANAYNSEISNTDMNNYSSDPKFINAAAISPDLHLQSTSPAIDKGVNVGLPFSGSAPDLGAYEYTGAAPATYALTIAKSGTGFGTVSGTGISCGSDCSEIVNSGTSVTLSASANSGSAFAGWSGGSCSGTGSCTVTVTSNTTVTATFNLSSDTQAPTVPANLAATAVSSSQINLSWTSSTDNVGVTGYRIYRCSGSGCTPSTQINTSATNSYSDTSLTANTTYVYRLVAYDAVGNASLQSSSASATTQSAPPQTGGLVAAYSFNTGTGTILADSSGNNTGTISGASWTTSGKYGNALSFDGVDDKVIIPNSNLSSNFPGKVQSSAFSVMAWVKFNSTPTTYKTIAGVFSPGQYSWRFGTTWISNGWGGLELQIYEAGSDYLRSTIRIIDTLWHHVAVVFNNLDSGNEARFFVDGSNAGIVSTAKSGAAISSADFEIGQDSYTGWKTDGLIDEIRVYNRALTQSEIQADMNTPIGETDTTPPSPPSGVIIN